MSKREVMSDAAALTAVLCAIILTGSTIRREFGPAKGSSGAAYAAQKKDERINDWRGLAELGHRWGAKSAPVVILEFGDFECPACRAFAVGAERSIKRQYAGKVSFVYRHWTLPYHRFAFPAAKASECAALQGRFHEMYQLLFEKQDSLGLKNFSSFARESGVADSDAFERCMSSKQVESIIARDTAAAQIAGGWGTPTIIVNGLRLAQTPDSASLDKLVRQALESGSVR